ncbi:MULTISPECIES: glycosyltransferase family 2 protein [unclassified Corynebacterium]|uniref:glycosyltransferase family 2 protein n=1 Tax=unclassified Corynebacterium TaxID=2624378 RepID=UPI002167B10B|nr:MULTISPECIES: glycosyltransferase family 2 protein [unclassified Corynebacterium]MCS4489495.1 glycosyltransferase family 2 protein [Corynebacterium sp. ES2775-CONJ]MCS4531406.1 glycosyltransferase family 2 protein [Corynebacterium sp. ES2730-CONJ]
MNEPIAVVTVTFSPGVYLKRFIDSLESATSDGYELILADNGSVDGAPERAAADNTRITFLPTGGNLGYGSAINVAYEHLLTLRERRERREHDERSEHRDINHGDINHRAINSEYFLISNPDVEFQPGSIDALLNCARQARERGEKVAAVGPLIRQLDGTAYPSARAIPTLSNGIGHALFASMWPDNPWSRAYRNNAVMDRQREAGWLSGSCLLVSFDAFAEVGGFDERYFMYMEDVDLGDRFARAGYVNIFCPDAEITHAVGHAASKLPEKMLPAHHDSAYRFQADRHPGFANLPIRFALWLGLRLRSIIMVQAARHRRDGVDGG